MSKIEKEIESYLENKEYEIDYKKQLGSTNLSKVEFGEKDGCETYLNREGVVVRRYTCDIEGEEPFSFTITG